MPADAPPELAICASSTRPTVPGPIKPMDSVFGDR